MKVGQIFRVGDKVVYPNHGVAVVDQISSQPNGFLAEQYYNLTIQSSGLKVMVPCRNAEVVGLRSVAGKEEIENIFVYLGDEEQPVIAEWRDRYREYCEKMKTGSLTEAAQVLKSLLVQSNNKPLGERDAKLLERTRHLLRNEIALAMGWPEAEAEARLTEAVRKGSLEFPEVAVEE